MEEATPFEPVSALDFHVLRSAFKTSISELLIPEARWAEHATAMVRELTDDAHVDTGMIQWIIRK
jgi:hypothetical protein